MKKLKTKKYYLFQELLELENYLKEISCVDSNLIIRNLRKKIFNLFIIL